MLFESGWIVQNKTKIEFSAGLGIAVREYGTDVGPADYVLFVGKKAVGVVEAKPEEWGHKITTVEEQSGGYAAAKLKWVNNEAPLPFVYESTGVLTRFTDGRDPKPRSREVFRPRQPRGERACDRFRQRVDDPLRETAPARTRNVHGDRQNRCLHPVSRFDDLSHRDRRRLGPAHEGLLQQRLELRIVPNGVAPKDHGHEAGSYSKASIGLADARRARRRASPRPPR